MLLHILGSLLLSAVFLIAGALKLSDLANTARSLVEFRVPQSLSGPGALALALAEITVGVALWPAATAGWGAAGALALLLLFMAAIGWNLLHGRQPACRCFGQVSARPVGQSTLVRNAVLAAVAALLLANDAPTPGITDLLSRVDLLPAVTLIGSLVVFVALGIGAWLVLNLIQQQGRLLLRLEALESRLGGHYAQLHGTPAQAVVAPGLPVGGKAPGFELPALLEETTLSMQELLDKGRPTMLVFSDPSCGPCNQLMPAIAAWQKELENKVTVAFVNRGDRKANEEKARTLGLQNVLLQAGDEVANSFEVYGTPCAVLVGADGLIQFPAASGSTQIEGLFQKAGAGVQLTPLELDAVPADSKAGPAQVGEPAPEFTLPNMTGQAVRLGDKVDKGGKKTLLLFWNPGCGFCSQMLDRLKQWEAGRSDLSPQLVLISTGTVQANSEMGLRSEILLDQSFGVGSLFGAGGTPSAILVDGHGRIASPLVVGAGAVFKLADSGQSLLEPV